MIPKANASYKVIVSFSGAQHLKSAKLLLTCTSIGSKLVCSLCVNQKIFPILKIAGMKLCPKNVNGSTQLSDYSFSSFHMAIFLAFSHLATISMNYFLACFLKPTQHLMWSDSSNINFCFCSVLVQICFACIQDIQKHAGTTHTGHHHPIQSECHLLGMAPSL